MINKTTLILATAIVGFINSASAVEVDILVAGYKTGTYTLASNMLLKDSKEGVLKDIQVTLTEPGDACKGYTIASERQSTDTFLIPVENLLNESASVRKDPLCVSPDLTRATPVYTEIQSLYLVTKKSFNVADMKSKQLNIGYTGTQELLKDWNNQMNKVFGQDHRFVGYNGSGAGMKGLLSGEVDGVWLTATRIVQLEKSNPGEYTAIYSTIKERDDQAPTLTDVFNDKTLSRAFVTTWWLFNDKEELASKFSNSLENMYKTGTGEWGKWASTSGKILKFNATEQKALNNSQTWLVK